MRRSVWHLSGQAISVVLLLSVCPSLVHAQERGLAAKYPKDVGISRDKAVLFHDDFEAEKVGATWDELNLRKVRGATGDTAPVEAETDNTFARGKRSAKVQLRKDGHEDVTFVKLLKPGHDELFMRHYVRYGKDYGYHGHGGSGFMADAGKGGFKGAGKAPDGAKYFWATLEPIGPRNWEPPGALIFYAYWWKMKPDGRGNYWGNWFQPRPDQVPKRETWICVEWRVKANTAGKDDGELDCWIEGKKCGEFREINWRSSDTVKVNKVVLSPVAGAGELRTGRRRNDSHRLVRRRDCGYPVHRS